MPRTVAVVGGGISGLAACYHLVRAPRPPKVMLGGAWFQQSLGDPRAVPPELLLSRARAAVREQLGLGRTPDRAAVRVQQDCIPQYTLGHWEQRIQRFLQEQRLPLSLIGASYRGVSVNDCIAGAKAAVGRVLGVPP
uniref:Protoporphyrinogen oxidase n=1 Tax=Catharus ustulatus TaxID=91951 RepID=A0A8C3UWP8_CATUS